MCRNAYIFIQVWWSAVKNELGQLRMVVVLEKDWVWLDFCYNVEEFWKDPLPDICSCSAYNQHMSLLDICKVCKQDYGWAGLKPALLLSGSPQLGTLGEVLVSSHPVWFGYLAVKAGDGLSVLTAVHSGMSSLSCCWPTSSTQLHRRQLPLL